MNSDAGTERNAQFDENLELRIGVETVRRLSWRSLGTFALLLAMCTALTALSTSSAHAADYKVYPGVMCAPDKTDNWAYTDGGIFTTGSGMSVTCPIYRDKVGESTWDEIVIYVVDRDTETDIQCYAQIVRAGYTVEREQLKTSTGTGYQKIKIDSLTSSAGNRAVYGFWCQLAKGTASQRTGILGYRVEE